MHHGVSKKCFYADTTSISHELMFWKQKHLYSSLRGFLLCGMDFFFSCNGSPINLFPFSCILNARYLKCVKSAVLIFIGMLLTLLTGYWGTVCELSLCFLWDILHGDFFHPLLSL